MHLNKVFGIATTVNPASYVNRGGLDEILGYYLGAERHIAIHGDSKQGKSWLRSKLLDFRRFRRRRGLMVMGRA